MGLAETQTRTRIVPQTLGPGALRFCRSAYIIFSIASCKRNGIFCRRALHIHVTSEQPTSYPSLRTAQFFGAGLYMMIGPCTPLRPCSSRMELTNKQGVGQSELLNGDSARTARATAECKQLDKRDNTEIVRSIRRALCSEVLRSGWIVHGLLLKFQHGEQSCATCTTMDPVYGRLRQFAAAAGRQFTATSPGMGCSPIRMSAWTYSNKSAVGSFSIRMLIATLDYQRSSHAFLRKLGFAFNRRE